MPQKPDRLTKWGRKVADHPDYNISVVMACVLFLLFLMSVSYGQIRPEVQYKWMNEYFKKNNIEKQIIDGKLFTLTNGVWTCSTTVVRKKYEIFKYKVPLYESDINRIVEKVIENIQEDYILIEKNADKMYYFHPLSVSPYRIIDAWGNEDAIVCSLANGTKYTFPRKLQKVDTPKDIITEWCPFCKKQSAIKTNSKFITYCPECKTPAYWR